MKLNELSAEDQALLKTEFSPELEKEAAEQVKVAQELYTTGFSKFASETAETLEKIAEEGEKEEEDDKEHEKKLNEEQKKEASARGAFIAKGYIDGLKKLGQEKYQDEMAYLYPFINEKLAMMGKALSYGKDMAAKAAPHAAKAMAAAKGAVKHPAASHGAAAAAGAAGLKGLQMLGRKKEQKAE